MLNSQFEMAPKAKAYYPTLTIFRAFAAWAVAIHHAVSRWQILSFKSVTLIGFYGWVGVSFFFALSGFVLTCAHFQEDPIPKRQFYIKRAIRIYPMHILTWLIAVLLTIFVGTAFTSFEAPIYSWPLNLIMVHDWLPLSRTMSQGLNSVSWTLSCELFFYLLAPFIIERLRKLSPARILSLLISLLGVYYVMVAVFNWQPDFMDMVSYWPPFRLLDFLAGCLIGVYFMKTKQKIEMKWYLPVAWVLSMIVLQERWPASENFFPALTASCLPAFLLLIYGGASRQDASSSSGRESLLRRFFIKAGDASFVFYMIHFIFLGVMAELISENFGDHLTDLEQIYAVVSYLISATLLSFLLHSYFDRPVHKYLSRHFLSRASVGTQA